VTDGRVRGAGRVGRLMPVPIESVRCGIEIGGGVKREGLAAPRETASIDVMRYAEATVVRRAARVAAVAVLITLAGCGEDMDSSSRQSCDSTRAMLEVYDQYGEGPEELRALALDQILPKLREAAGAAKGEVRTAIGQVADTIDQADLDDSELITTLRPKFAEFDPKFATARQSLEQACA